MTFADLSEACRISERTLKGYVKEKRLGNFYPFSVAMIAVGGRYEELLKELKGNDFGSMPLFCRTGFARANAFSVRRRQIGLGNAKTISSCRFFRFPSVKRPVPSLGEFDPDHRHIVRFRHPSWSVYEYGS